MRRASLGEGVPVSHRAARRDLHPVPAVVESSLSSLSPPGGRRPGRPARRPQEAYKEEAQSEAQASYRDVRRLYGELHEHDRVAKAKSARL